MDFTAIDFETANSGYTSVCSLGWCVVKDNRITERREVLIKPEPFRFNDYNIKIHGITPEMVYDKPTFDKCWEEIKPYIEDKMVIAHNASFDVRVLCTVLEQFKIELPEFEYMCTVKLSQKAYPELSSHKLNNLCDALNIKFNHHHAYDDAYACASAFLRIAEDYSMESFEDMEECFDVKRGRVYPGCGINAKKKKHRHPPCRKKTAEIK